MIKNFTPRLYQETILSTTTQKNTLVVLPTGLGKTNIFMMLAAHRLKQYPNSKILLLGPTRPLIDQYFSVFEKHFEIEKENMAIFTGHVKPEKREVLWKNSKIIFSTPQGLENDIINKRIKLEEVSLLGFDEAHRAVKEYSYVWVAKQYNLKAAHPRILALTASPGSNTETISEVCKNLYIEDIEVRADNDPDVRQYIKEIKIDWVLLDLPEEIKDTLKNLKDIFKSKIDEVKKYGHVSAAQARTYSKKDFLSMQAALHGEIAKGNKDFAVLKSVSLLAEAMKIEHAIELLETQGVTPLKIYMEKLMQQAKTSKVKAVQNLVKDLNFRTALIKTERLAEKDIEHPKLEKLKQIIQEEIKKDNTIKIIIFNQYRDSGEKITSLLNSLPDISAKLFVGQAKKGDTGLSQKKQKEILDEFRENKFNILVATSVAEEGLDIPKVDIVIFYEPIPSAIRQIQRRGRTGRQEKGRMIALVTKNTRDEAYRWSAHHKEKRMHSTLKTIKQKLFSVFKKSQPTLQRFVSEDEKIKIFADYREKGSGVIKELIDLGAEIKMEKLESADFLLSSRAAVEYKTNKDFVTSIIDGRLLQQIKELKKNFERPILIIEGDTDIYSVRNIHPNAIRGMLATIAVSYGIPVLQTKNFKETSSLLYIIAKREQDDTKKDFTLHGDKKPMTLKEQQEYIISSLPSVGPNLAKELLKQFKTVRSIINADEQHLKKVDKVGDKIAKKINETVNKTYAIDTK